VTTREKSRGDLHCRLPQAVRFDRSPRFGTGLAIAAIASVGRRRGLWVGIFRTLAGAFAARRAPLLLVGLVMSGLLAPAPAVGGESFSARVRATESRARQRIAATARAAAPGRYAYYTVGDVWKYSGPAGWAAGYVPGGMWSCYQLSGREWWRDEATGRQAAIGAAPVTGDTLNTGALFFPTYVRAYSLTGEERFRRKGIAAAMSAAQRFDPEVGAMLSRPTGRFNVIVDSLSMKPRLLWWAARNGGPPELADIARQHVLTTARDFLRPDGSTYHIVYYDADTGAVLEQGQSSGYSADSTWARGQAWAILGFAAAYRQEPEPAFLTAARAASDWYLDHLPPDLVPYWDFGDPAIPEAPRDSSAAAIAASGLLDLALLDPDPERRERYEAAARATLSSLMSKGYASLGANPAVLLHGTYLWRAGITDRGLAYGDAFFLEALLRLRRLAPDSAPLALVEARAASGVAAAAVDGDLTTRWSSRGRVALDVRLAGTREVGAVRVAIARGDRRAAKLRILVSADGRRWRLARQSMTSGEVMGYETFCFAPRQARWVRLQCDGTTAGPVNRIAEVEVYPAF
jgi:unsaturated chondroitin disaccharide hydrolase